MDALQHIVVNPISGNRANRLSRLSFAAEFFARNMEDRHIFVTENARDDKECQARSRCPLTHRFSLLD